MAGKNEIFDIKSKQLRGVNGSKDNNTNIAKAALKELEEIRSSNDEHMTSIRKLNTTIRRLLDPTTVALPEQVVYKKNAESEVVDGNLLRIIGKTKNKGQDLEDYLKAKIEEQTHQVSLYSHTGIYAKILEARQNNFMQDNLPILETACRLYVDDVCNGVYRGSEYGAHNKFKFYKNGAEIKESLEIDKMIEILNPTNYTQLMDDVKSFDEINSDGEFISRKNGNSVAWIIRHKDVAIDLYCKYVAKEVKRTNSKDKKLKKKQVAKVKNKKSLESINEFLEDMEYNISISMETDLVKTLSEEILREIPEELYVSEYEYYETIGNEDYPISKFEFDEYNKKESFSSFAERYLTGQLHPVYNINSEGKDTISGECFTYEIGSYTKEVGQSVLRDIFSKVDDKFIGLESTTFAVESFNPMSAGDARCRELANEVSFEDIYNTSLNMISSYNNIGNGAENRKFGLESSVNLSFNMNKLKNAEPKTKADRFYLDIFKHLNNKSSSKVSMEYSPIRVDNTLNPSYGTLELSGVPTDTKITGQRDAFDKQIEEKVKNNNASRGRLEKMFAGIKGETTIYLDNTRTIHNMSGNKLLGVFYIEYTHQDIQHYVGLRTIIGNPVSFTQNIDMLNIDTDRQEETLGRLIFSDTIKPLLEKNMDTKFLKNNAHMLFTIKKLLEENEISNSMSFQDMTRFSMYNLSRVIYIPSTELIFRRNGNEGLGESLFNKALVPATARILAAEAYLSWILCDGKGMTFITMNKGLSESGTEYGTEPFKDKIDNMIMSRSKLRDIAFNNSPLTRRVMLLVKNEEADGTLDIQNVDPPEFDIDQDMIYSWENQATEIVGYSASLFQSRDGQVELAKKLFEINDAQLIRIIKSRKNMKVPASQLATKLLHARGGEDYYDVTVEWMEPPIESNNNMKRGENFKNIKDALDSALDIFDSIYEGNEEYELAKPELAKIVLVELSDNDKILTTTDDLLKEAVGRAKVKLTQKVSEDEDEEETKKKEEEKKDNEETEEEGNPFAEANEEVEEENNEETEEQTEEQEE